MIENATLHEQSQNDQLVSLNNKMETLAGACEWDQIAEIMARRNTMLKSVEGTRREAALIAARRTTLRVQQMVESARNEAAEKLGQLRRGRKATDSYRAHA